MEISSKQPLRDKRKEKILRIERRNPLQREIDTWFERVQQSECEKGLLQSDGRNLIKGKRKENKIIIIREWETRGGRKALNLKGKTEWRMNKIFLQTEEQ